MWTSDARCYAFRNRFVHCVPPVSCWEMERPRCEVWGVRCYDKYCVMCVRDLISTPGVRREAGHDTALSACKLWSNYWYGTGDISISLRPGYGLWLDHLKCFLTDLHHSISGLVPFVLLMSLSGPDSSDWYEGGMCAGVWLPVKTLSLSACVSPSDTF